MSHRTPDSQLTNYAFTITGWACELEEEIQTRPIPMFITAYNPSSTSWRVRLDVVGTNKIPNTFLSDTEQVAPGYQKRQYLVVGIIPANLPSESEVRSVKHRGSTGIWVPDNVIRPLPEKMPIRVVTPVISELRGGIKLYALTDADEGTRLCNAYVVKQDIVFYFSEYRTAAPTAALRKKEWNDRVLATSVRARPQEQSIMPSDTSLPGAPPNCPPEIGFINELQLLAISLDLSSQMGTVDRLLRLLDKADPGKSSISRFDRRIIDTFLSGDATETFTKDDAQILSNQVSELWPEVRGVTPEKLILLREGIKRSKITIPYQHARGLVTLGCRKVEDHTEGLDIFVQNTIKDVQEVVGSKTPRSIVPANNGPAATVISATTDMLREISTKTKECAERVATAHGNRILALPRDVLIQRILVALDNDKRQLLYRQLLLTDIRELGKWIERIPCELDTVISLFDELTELLV